MWDALDESLTSEGKVEYGMFQRQRILNISPWRHHDIGRRFDNLSNALFGKNGARNACVGTVQYPKDQYAADATLLVPYVATWLKNTGYAYLIRASAGDPEITIIATREIDVLNNLDESALCVALAEIFAAGARRFGIRLLDKRSIRQQ